MNEQQTDEKDAPLRPAEGGYSIEGHYFSTNAQALLLGEYVERVLADVFQGRKPELREHLLGVAAKVSRKHPWPFFEECVVAEVERRLATRILPPGEVTP